MSAETERFRQLDRERAEAKQKMLVALGEAKLKDSHGWDSSAEWATVAEYGMSGVEGEKRAAMQALADSYVTAHPELFAMFEPYANPAGFEQLVTMAGLFKQTGLADEYAMAAMFELAKFERQKIGVETKPEMRLLGTRGRI